MKLNINMMNLGKIGFIGANGRLSRAMIKRFCEKGYRDRVIGSVRTDQSNPYCIELTKNPQFAFDNSDFVVIGLKPEQIIPVLSHVRVRPGTIIFSPAAGLSCKDMMSALNTPEVSVVRGMLNTAVSVGETVTILTSFKTLSERQKLMVDEFVSVLGKGFWVSNDEKLDELTPAAGCGLVYFFKIVQSMTDKLVKSGLSETEASQIALQLLQGAATLSASSSLSAAQLTAEIVTPGGPTDKLIEAANKAGFEEMITRSLNAASERCKQMRAELAPKNVLTCPENSRVTPGGFFGEACGAPAFPRKDFGLEDTKLQHLIPVI